MATTQLTLSNDGLIAEFFGPEKFKAFFEKRLEVPADYLGLLRAAVIASSRATASAQACSTRSSVSS